MHWASPDARGWVCILGVTLGTISESIWPWSLDFPSKTAFPLEGKLEPSPAAFLGLKANVSSGRELRKSARSNSAITAKITSRRLLIPNYSPSALPPGPVALTEPPPPPTRDPGIRESSAPNYISRHALQRPFPAPPTGRRGPGDRSVSCRCRGISQSLPLWLSLQPWTGCFRGSRTAARPTCCPLSGISRAGSPPDFLSGFRARRSLGDGMKGVGVPAREDPAAAPEAPSPRRRWRRSPWCLRGWEADRRRRSGPSAPNLGGRCWSAACAMATSAASSEHFEKLHEIFRGLHEDLRGVPERLLGMAGTGEARAGRAVGNSAPREPRE